jgi:hypothetical protein
VRINNHGSRIGIAGLREMMVPCQRVESQKGIEAGGVTDRGIEAYIKIPVMVE